MTVRARFDGRVFIPAEPVDLRRDQLVDLDVHAAPVLPKGSAAAVLEAMHASPHLEPGDAAALERSIEEGRLRCDRQSPH